jgi:hypothetical protein
MPRRNQASQRGRKRAARALTAGACYWCGVHCSPQPGPWRKATWDHLVPQAQDPTQGYNLRGMVRACAPCNSARQDTPAHEWARRMRHGVDRASRAW